MMEMACQRTLASGTFIPEFLSNFIRHVIYLGYCLWIYRSVTVSVPNIILIIFGYLQNRVVWNMN